MLLAVDAGNTNIVFAPVETDGLATLLDTHTSTFDRLSPISFYPGRR